MTGRLYAQILENLELHETLPGRDCHLAVVLQRARLSGCAKISPKTCESATQRCKSKSVKCGTYDSYDDAMVTC